MSRGITEQDVWKAADALLLEGARPTIERVRLKIGRGSPNTVSPHLESWFARLGARIADPQAFRAPETDAPEPVRELARQLWETAQALAHQAAETRALQAEDQARQARAERDAQAAEFARVQALAQAQAAELDALRLQLAATQAAQAERDAAQARALAGTASSSGMSPARAKPALAGARQRDDLRKGMAIGNSMDRLFLLCPTCRGAPGSRPTRDYSRSIPRGRFHQGFFDARHASSKSGRCRPWMSQFVSRLALSNLVIPLVFSRRKRLGRGFGDQRKLTRRKGNSAVTADATEQALGNIRLRIRPGSC